MNNYKKYLEKAKKNKELPLDKEKKKKQDLLSMLKRYSEGSVNVQSNEEKAIEAGENARREAVNRTLASEDKKEKKINPNDYIQLNNPNKFSDGTDNVPKDDNNNGQTFSLESLINKKQKEDPSYGGSLNLGNTLNNLPIEHKYSMGIPSVPSPMGSPSANTTSSLSPLLKNTYGKMPGALAGFLHNKKMGNIQHFNDGGDVLSNLEQTFRKAFGYNEPAPTPHEETRDEKYARIRHQNLVNANEAPGQHNDVSDSKFSDGTSSVPDSIEDKAKKYGWSQDQVNYLKSLRHDIPQSPTQVQQPTQIPQGTEQGIHIDPVAAQNVAQAFAHGGMVKEHGELYKKFLNLYGGSPKVESDKVQLSLPRAAHMTIPKRLHPVTDTKFYADGSPDVEESSPGVEVDDSDDAMVQKYRKLGLLKGPTIATSDQANVIGSIPKDEEDDTEEVAKDNGPYPGEEEEAQKVSDELPSEEIAKASDDKDDEDLQAKKEVEEEDKKLAETEETPKDDELEAKYDKEEKDAEDNSDLENKERKISSEEENKKDEEEVDKPQDVEEAKKEAAKSDIQPDNNPMQRLKDAQDSQRNNILFNQLGKITDKMGASMGHFTPQNQDIYDENIKNADLPVKQLEQQIQMEKFDPNSNTSKAFRQYLTKFGGEDVAKLGNISAAQAEQIAPMAFKQFEAQQAQQAKAMELEERNKERLQQAQMIVDQKREASKDRLALLGAAKGQKSDADKQRHDDKMEAKDIDRVDKLNKAINAEMSNGRSAFGIAAKNKQAVENAKALLNGEVDYNNLDNRQVVELARTLDRVLSGGNSTISGSEHLTPESARSWLSKKMEFITNKRQGAQAGSFIKTIAGTLDREGQQADKQILKAQSAFMGPYKSLAKNDKDSRSYQNYVNTLKSNNLNALLPKDEQETVEPQTQQIPQAPTTQLAPNEVKRTTKDGRTAIFDGNTKKFLRYQ